MMLGFLLAIPLVGSGLLWRADGRVATALHALTAGLTLVAAIAVSVEVNRGDALVALDGFLRADALSAWMISLIGIVGALAASEAPRYLAHTTPARFYPLFHLFVFTMLLAVSTDDVGLMWVAVEGTTLASVFLVNFERTRASLEASYKYLLICSVGIAIAFLGTVLVYFAGIQQFGDEAHALRWTTLLRLAPGLAPRVIELAFVFLVVGYGTKAGLAPMHTWLPDAHSEAPAPVSAPMSGVLLSVGVYAILRFKPAVDVAARRRCDLRRRLHAGSPGGRGGGAGPVGGRSRRAPPGRPRGRVRGPAARAGGGDSRVAPRVARRRRPAAAPPDRTRVAAGSHRRPRPRRRHRGALRCPGRRSPWTP